jgi:hypothetical protein
MLKQARETDVVAITALGQRSELFELLTEKGVRPMDPARCRQLVRRARPN